MLAREPLSLSQLPQRYSNPTREHNHPISRNPSPCWNNPNTKVWVSSAVFGLQTNTKPSENLKYEPNHDLLCRDSIYNPCWVPEELRNSAFLGLRGEADDYNGDDEKGKLCIGSKETKKQGIRASCKIQQEEEEEEVAALTVGDSIAHPKFQQNINELFSIVALLKECAEQNDLVRGTRVHDDVVRRGLLEKNIFIGNALVSMYAKCGALTKAQEVCDNLPVRNEVSWNSMISGYTQHGHGEEAFSCFVQMQDEGLSPSAVTYACILKAIGSLEAVDEGRKIHAQIVKEGLFEKHVIVGTALVDMYSKSGFLAEAHQVFDQLSCRNVVSCNALIAGYAKHGHGKEAMSLFEQMQLEDLSPSAVTFICIAKACGSLRDPERAQEIHAETVKRGVLEKDVVVANALVDMYAKCGQLAEAHTVFNKLPTRDVVSFSALIAGYAQQGHGEQALKCYEQMRHEGFSPDAVTYVCVLKVCILTNVASKRDEIHAQIVRDGLLEKDLFVGSALVDMYAKCGILSKAQEVFDKLPVRNVVAYSALIAGYAQHGPAKEALNCFDRMQLEGLSPNALTFTCIFRACASIGAADRGEEIHGRFITDEWLEKELVLGTSLVDMYAKFGSLTKAQEVFDKLPVRDIVCWNALIAGYTQHGQVEESLRCFEMMQFEDVSPDEATFSCILKACASIEAAEKGQEIYAMIVKESDLEKDIIVGTALVDMYAKCGLLAEAKDVFDRLRGRNVVSWNALLGGYAQHGHDEEALDCFRQMQLESISSNAITFNIILRACCSAGAAYKGQEIHVGIARERLLEEDASVGIALADMYAKCGLLGKAHDVLYRLPVWNVVVWNTLIAAYAQLGRTENVFKLFDTMLKEGINPDLVTFTIVLNACSHAGLLNQGQMYFEAMSTAYGIMPALEQHTCMVDLFCRAGHLDKAVTLIKEMPLCTNLTVWLTLLGACQTWGDVKIGRLAFEHGAQLDGKDTATYICISNIYAAAGRQEDVDRMEAT